MDVEELGYSAEENTGEVCFRGAGLMDGYFNDPELTLQTVDQEVNPRKVNVGIIFKKLAWKGIKFFKHIIRSIEKLYQILCSVYVILISGLVTYR